MKAARSLAPVASNATPAKPVVSAAEIAEYMPLVRQIAARFLAKVPPNVLRDDLIAAGTYGLIDSLRKNAGEKGATFEWYARVRIRGAILDELRTQDWLGRRARSRQREEAERGAAVAGVIALEDLSDATRGSLRDDSIPSPGAAAEQMDERKALGAAMGALLEREKLIVELHYFRGVAFKDIAAQLQVSEPRVSQLHTRALGKLRARLAEGAATEPTAMVA